MGDDVVHGPVSLFQRSLRCGVLDLTGQLLFPLGPAVDPEQGTLLTQTLEFLLELRVVRLQNIVGDVVATGAAHGEKPLAVDVVELASRS